MMQSRHIRKYIQSRAVDTQVFVLFAEPFRHEILLKGFERLLIAFDR